MAESVLNSTNLDESSSFYILQIRTSAEFGSSLSDADAAILLSFIDVNGDSVLQRIPTVLSGHSPSVSEGIHFQRGSVDVLGFHGPKLGDIKALWVGLESGFSNQIAMVLCIHLLIDCIRSLKFINFCAFKIRLVEIERNSIDCRRRRRVLVQSAV